MTADVCRMGPVREKSAMRRRPRPSLLSVHGTAVLGAVGVALLMMAVMLLLMG